MPDYTSEELAQLNSIADRAHISDPAHLLVESMASPQVVANSSEGRSNFDAAAIKQLKGKGHNYKDTRTLEQELSDLHPSHSKPEDLKALNDKLGNTVVVDSAIDGGNGNWKAGW